MASPAIREAIKQIEIRLDELRPAYDEFRALAEFAEKFHGFIYDPTRETRDVEQKPVAAQAEAVRGTRSSVGKAKSTKAAAKPPKTDSGSTAEGRSRHGETLQRIRDIVANHPDGIRVGDIINEGQLSTSYTYDVVKRLIERGEFHKANQRIYPQEQFQKRQRPTVSRSKVESPAT